MDSRIPMNDFLSMLLGKKVTVYFKNKRVQELILKEIYLSDKDKESEIKSSYIKVADEIGFTREILVDNIESIDFQGICFETQKSNNERETIDEEITQIRALVKEKNNVAASTRFDSLSVFQSEVERLKMILGDGAVSDFLSVDKINRVTLGENDFQYFVKELKAAEDRLDSYTFLIGELILSLEARKFKECMARCMKLLSENEDDEIVSRVYFALSFITNQVRDYDQSFFWLEKYFGKMQKEIAEDNFLWWRYLFNTVEFCSYENLGNLLKYVYGKDRMLCIRSLCYVLALNNLSMQAAYVWSFTSNAAVDWEELESIYNHLRTEKDNKYHRFLRCVEYISTQKKYQIFETDEKLKGLVFDYVPYRGYGFILGYDMVKYYFHVSEVDSMTLKNIRREICSISHVSEEELCQVSFARTVDSKRSYEAYSVV